MLVLSRRSWITFLVDVGDRSRIDRLVNNDPAAIAQKRDKRSYFNDILDMSIIDESPKFQSLAAQGVPCTN